MSSIWPSGSYRLWLYGTVLCASSFVITGYGIYQDNQPIQIPLVLLLNDPSLYPSDPFAATLPYYASTLWRAVALLNRIVPIDALFFLLFVLERFFLMYASARLALTYAPGSTLPVIGTMAFFALAPQPLFGGGTIVKNYFEQTGFSIPFFLLAAASLYRSRPMATAIWLSIGFNLNSMYGIFALTYLTAAFLTSPPPRFTWPRWGMAIILFLLLSIPVLFLSASAFFIDSPDEDLWLLASELRVPHHLYPLTWRVKNFILFDLFIVVAVLLLRHHKAVSEKLFKFSIVWTAVALLWVLYAFVAAYVAKSPALLVLQPARGADLWYCFVGAALICACGVSVEKQQKPKRIYATIFFIVILFWHPSYLLLLSPLLILWIWMPAWKAVLKEGDINRLASVLTLMILFLCGYLLHIRVKQKRNALLFRPDESVVEVANWAKERTDVRTTFLAPPSWRQFRGLSHRGLFVTRKDGAAILWHRQFVGEWSKRLAALGYDMTRAQKGGSMTRDLARLYDALNDQQVQKIKKEFPIHFWIVPVEHVSSFPVAFQTENYKVLDLK